MKKKNSVIFGVVATIIFLSGCTPQTINNNNPETVLKNFNKDIENGDFKNAVKLLNPDTVSSRGEIWAERWVKLNTYNVKSITIKDIRILGGTAHATVEITYKDGKTQKNAIDLIKNNGTWYISTSYSFKEGK